MLEACVHPVFGLWRDSSSVASCLIKPHLPVAAYPNGLPDSGVMPPVSMGGITGIYERSVHERCGIEIAQHRRRQELYSIVVEEE